MMSQEKHPFVDQARGKRTTLLRELWGLLVENKKWWLAPILLAVLILGLLVALSGTPAAPFVYTLF